MSDDSVRWLLSFYRSSEIGGALFFGQLARTLRPGRMQADLTRHFADEARHASYWTDCLAKLDLEPLGIRACYQDRYLAAAGVPANFAEVLAITHVFEQRVALQYAAHLRLPALEPAIAQTLTRILADERWHLRWVAKALNDSAAEFGQDRVDAALQRYRDADATVYRSFLDECDERTRALFSSPEP